MWNEPTNEATEAVTADSPEGSSIQPVQSQGLKRLHEKVLASSVAAPPNGDRYTEDDLLQVSYALAKRQLAERDQEELQKRERLTEAHLGIPWSNITISSVDISGIHIMPVLRMIGAQLSRHPEVEFEGANPATPPRWRRFEIGREIELAPDWATIYWDPHTVADVPLVLQTWDKPGCQLVQVFSRPEDQETAKAYLDRLIDEARGPMSPYRGRLLKASSNYGPLTFEILPDPVETRDELILPAPIWEGLDLNVHRMFEKMGTFQAAGLGSNRGVLLAGSPGTGKTAACRVLANEVLGDITAVFIDSRLAQIQLSELYSEISGLTPALVLLEDLDLLVGARHDKSARWALLDFLSVLDGLMTQHRDVVTVATTNDPEAIDAGVRRAARFDRIITFPLPDESARARILGVYLRSLNHSVDLSAVAAVTEGMTGADLREYVRAALLSATEPLTTEDLLRVVPADDTPNGAGPGGAPAAYI